VPSIDPSPAAALTLAFKANDAARVAELLAHHPELRSKVNEPLPELGFGQPPLLGAVQRGNREMIEVLLRAGADIHQRSQWWAGGFGVLDDAWRAPWLAPFLIERGAVVDVHAAVRLGMHERLAELLAANPDLVHARGGDGQTPLHCAQTIEVARFLLDHGAEIDARDIDHESTPAQYMVRDRQDVARYLVARGCHTDLLMAAALGDVELVRRHLDADPACIRMSVSEQYFPKQDPRAGGTIYIWCLGWHQTAHLVARELGHEEVFRLLMERSPAELKLAQACELGDEEAFEALLASRPDLAQTLSDDERRKLAGAAQNNNTAAVRMMLAAGWPVDARGEHGGTPLHWAAFHGNAEMAREILRRHPPLELRDDQFDQPPLGWALHGSEHGWYRESGDYAGTVEALLAAGAQAPPSTADLAASEPVRAVLRRRQAALPSLGDIDTDA
jgi:ankyrin repeat protein